MYLEQFKLNGRVALVTGGAQGIGHACVEALAEAGAHVDIADRNLEAGAGSGAAMHAKGYAAGGHRDRRHEFRSGRRRRRRHVRQGDRHSGQQRRHRALQRAGRRRDRRALAERPRRQPQRLVLVLPCVRHTHAGGGTRLIVNIGSMSGFIVNRPQQQANYNASKAACIISRARSPRNGERAACASTPSRRPTSRRRSPLTRRRTRRC